ncbi:hypothetical protein JHW43_009283, partial [Diplocarpon mali]
MTRLRIHLHIHIRTVDVSSVDIHIRHIRHIHHIRIRFRFHIRIHFHFHIHIHFHFHFHFHTSPASAFPRNLPLPAEERGRRALAFPARVGHPLVLPFPFPSPSLPFPSLPLPFPNWHSAARHRVQGPVGLPQRVPAGRWTPEAGRPGKREKFPPPHATSTSPDFLPRRARARCRNVARGLPTAQTLSPPLPDPNDAATRAPLSRVPARITPRPTLPRLVSIINFPLGNGDPPPRGFGGWSPRTPGELRSRLRTDWSTPEADTNLDPEPRVSTLESPTSTFNLQPPTFNLQPRPSNLDPPPSNLQLPPSIPSIPDPLVRPSRTRTESLQPLQRLVHYSAAAGLQIQSWTHMPSPISHFPLTQAQTKESTHTSSSSSTSRSQREELSSSPRHGLGPEPDQVAHTASEKSTCHYLPILRCSSGTKSCSYGTESCSQRTRVFAPASASICIRLHPQPSAGRRGLLLLLLLLQGPFLAVLACRDSLPGEREPGDAGPDTSLVAAADVEHAPPVPSLSISRNTTRHDSLSRSLFHVLSLISRNTARHDSLSRSPHLTPPRRDHARQRPKASAGPDRGVTLYPKESQPIPPPSTLPPATEGSFWVDVLSSLLPSSVPVSRPGPSYRDSWASGDGSLALVICNLPPSLVFSRGSRVWPVSAAPSPRGRPALSRRRLLC